uniref:Uncharacterized protein LOC114343402 n=1 Tax=Diabrotica virgifera virgifera TaxID=50390 RepID=A0A6P7GJC4_DIAVI
MLAEPAVTIKDYNDETIQNDLSTVPENETETLAHPNTTLVFPNEINPDEDEPIHNDLSTVPENGIGTLAHPSTSLFFPKEVNPDEVIFIFLIQDSLWNLRVTNTCCITKPRAISQETLKAINT